MRKNLPFKICDTEVLVPINFDTIERIERAFGANADVIASVLIPNMQTIQYTKLARTVADVLFGYCDLKREAVLDYIVSADAKEIAQYALNLQAACMYLRNQIDDADFEKIVQDGSAKKTTGDAS